MKTKATNRMGWSRVGRAVRRFPGRGFTLIELLVVIAVIALLAALTVGGVTRASRAAREARIRAELSQLLTAIEGYKEALGFYPPDNPQNPEMNPLFYELSGMVVDNQLGEFRTADGSEVIPAAKVQQRFNLDGFANATPNPQEVRPFLEPKSQQYAETSTADDVEVLVVPSPWPLNAREQPLERVPGLANPVKGVNPWRYLGPSHATNNPGSFDLWAEFVDGNNVRVLGNWRSDAFVARPFLKQ